MLSSSDDIRSPSVSLSPPIQIWLWLYFAQRTRHGVPAPLQDRRRGRPDGTEGRRRQGVQAQGQGSPRPPQPHCDSSSPPKVSHLFYGPIRFRTIGLPTTIAAAVCLAPQSHVKRL
ncbi:hypothetical protein CEXT_77901 [Caerostris extrusa]|uniref:Uncharacterized protein n=1 Tax=Caerostris extrusa TaxID=172846 RepID=A0AAV4Y2X2_CAEEX|nr:hypothetical protein CEXT_77901 [Caerostris extrusa]